MTATVAERITQTKSDKPMLNNNGDGCRKTGIAVMKESDPKTLLHPAWLAFVRYCAELRHVARLLELDREEVSGRDICPTVKKTIWLRTAGCNPAHPEIKAGLIWLTIEEVDIVMTNIKPGVVDWIY